jgi:hypothetical protein
MNYRVGLCVLLLVATQAIAGGSNERVTVKNLETDGSDYTLVVIPEKTNSSNYPDPFMGSCEYFTVRGTYDRLWWLFRNGPPGGRESHMQALKALQEAHSKSEPIRLGWLGTGFKGIEKEQPCIVESKGLWLMEEEGKLTIMSFYDGI